MIIANRIERGPTRRHDARVRRFSSDPALLGRLDEISVTESGSAQFVSFVCGSFEVPLPELKFHARRSPYTGATEQPRWLLVATHGEEGIERLERGMRSTLPVHGAMRLGRTTTLMTLAHELGHHLVFALDPLSTPGHGKRWVHRFDQAAASMDTLLSSSLITQSLT